MFDDFSIADAVGLSSLLGSGHFGWRTNMLETFNNIAIPTVIVVNVIALAWAVYKITH